MRQVVNRVDVERQASAESSPSPQTPHPRATGARSRGIKFPISDIELLDRFRSWYNRHAEGRDNFDKFHHHLARQLDTMNLVGKRVLEVGCGKGTVSLFLALFGRCRHIVAVDEVAGEGAPVDVTRTLKEAATEFDVRSLEVIDADIMDNSFGDNSFDVIIANRALHHVMDSGFIRRDEATRREYVRMFRELKRLLVPDGVIVIIEISRLSFWRWSPLKLRQANIDWDIHPTRGEWLTVIREAGFERLALEFMVPYPLRQVRSFFTNPLAQFLLGPNFVIRARRPVAAPELTTERRS